MRTTLAIDDDVLQAARSLAARERKSVGEVRSALARQALRRPDRPASGMRNGMLLLPVQPGANAATLALVNQWRRDAP